MSAHGPLSVAVVGLGYGRAHITDIVRGHDGLRLAAVVDPIAPQDDPRLADFAERDAVLAAPHCASLDALLSDSVPDIVALATPIHTHLPLALQALRAGSHVLLEKPPTATLAEHRVLVDAGARASRAVQIGFQARGSEAIAAARALLDSDAIGEVESIGVIGAWVRGRSYFDRSPWAGRRQLDGVPVMDGVVTNPFAHAVDVALAVCGAFHEDDIEDVVVDPWRGNDIDTDDTTALRIVTRTGQRIGAAFTLCAERERPHPRISAYGTRGELHLDYTRDRIEVIHGGRSQVTHHRRKAPLSNLAAHICGAEPLVADAATTGAFMRVLEAVRTGPVPRTIGRSHLRHIADGSGRIAVSGVERWCETAARTASTFAEAGAPWT